MFQKNLPQKKFIPIASGIFFLLLMVSSLAKSPIVAQSPPENTQENESSTPTDSPTLNQPNSDNSDANNETREVSNETVDSFFNPPPLGAPKRTADAGARGSCPSLSSDKQPLTLVIPEYDPVTLAAVTISERPTFLWYLPQYKNLKSVVFDIQEVLDEENSKFLFQQTIPVSGASPGIISFQVPDSQPPLEIGKWYIWYLFVSSDEPAQENQDSNHQQENQRTQTNSQNCHGVEGIIGYRPLNSREQAELNAATNPEEGWNFYHQEMIWYDALATLDRLRRDYPEDETIEQRWQAFLGLIGLGELSEYHPVEMPERIQD